MAVTSFSRSSIGTFARANVMSGPGPLSIDITYLVVGGGAAGGGAQPPFLQGGGGGGGGVASGSLSGVRSFFVEVGAGAAGLSPTLSFVGVSNPSRLTTVEMVGGGWGGVWAGVEAGEPGACGGGGPGGASYVGGAGSVGGDGGGGASGAAGGGGGMAPANGGNAPSSYVGGTGAEGVSSSITGAAVIYGSGGGGGGENTLGPAGTNAGAGAFRNAVGDSAPANFGGGGGGSASNYGGGNHNGGAGGSGIVICAIPSGTVITIGAGLTYSMAVVGANDVYSFTAGLDIVWLG